MHMIVYHTSGRPGDSALLLACMFIVLSLFHIQVGYSILTVCRLQLTCWHSSHHMRANVPNIAWRNIHTYFLPSTHASMHKHSQQQQLLARTLVPLPVSLAAGGTAVAAPAAWASLAGCCCLTHTSQASTARPGTTVVTYHSDRCRRCQHPAQTNCIIVQLCQLLCWAWQSCEDGPFGFKCCRCCCPLWTPLLQLQQVAPLDLLGAAAAAAAM
jgi:hypothetical protein